LSAGLAAAEDRELLVELADLATTAFFERGGVLFDEGFFAAGARLGAVAFLEEAFFFEVLFLLDAPADLAVFLRVAPVFFAAFFVAFLADGLATFLRPGALGRLTVFFREGALATFLPLFVFLLFLAAARFAGISLASKQDYTKSAIIHRARGSESIYFAPPWGANGTPGAGSQPGRRCSTVTVV
jgi:hypothetical protein